MLLCVLAYGVESKIQGWQFEELLSWSKLFWYNVSGSTIDRREEGLKTEIIRVFQARYEGRGGGIKST